MKTLLVTAALAAAVIPTAATAQAIPGAVIAVGFTFRVMTVPVVPVEPVACDSTSQLLAPAAYSTAAVKA